VLPYVVQVELRDVGDEVAGEALDGLLEREIAREAIGLRRPLLRRRILRTRRAGIGGQSDTLLR